MSKIDELIERLCHNGVRFEELKNKKLFKFYYGKGNRIPEDIGGIYDVYGANGIVSHINEYNCEDVTIIGHIGTVGMVNRCKKKCFVTYNGTIAEVVDKTMVNSQYLYYVLTTLNLPSYKKGSQPFLSVSDFDKIRIPVPPLEVQCEIVHILDDFTLLSAELSAELKAREKQYDYYTEKIWSYLENEKRVRLDTICEIGDGLHGTPEYENNTKLWFVNGNNLENGRIIINKSTKEISNKSYNKYNGNYKIGTILMSINGTIGKIAYYTGEKIILGKSAAYFEVIEENTVCNKYLYYYLQSKKALQYFENNKTGSTIKNLGLKALREMKIPFPDRGKQEEIAGKLEKLDKLCNDISEGLPAEIEARQKQYEYYRDKLLTFKELQVNE